MIGAIVVFARAPGQGDAKTRLAPDLGAPLTASLYDAMLTDTLRNACQTGARVVLAHTGGSGFPQARLARDLVEQRGATFAERFDHALQAAYDLAGGPLVLVGADTPHLGPGPLRAALARLRVADAVLGPSREGGFYLFGCRGRPPLVRSALEAGHEAAAVARALGEVELLEATFDLDVAADVVELLLQEELLRAAGRTPWARETLRVLREAGVEVEPARSGDRVRRLRRALPQRP